jgi:hypothetical protein
VKSAQQFAGVEFIGTPTDRTRHATFCRIEKRQTDDRTKMIWRPQSRHVEHSD